MVNHQKLQTTSGDEPSKRLFCTDLPQSMADSSPSLSHSGSSNSKHYVTSSPTVYHHYEACAASEYLKPVPVGKSSSDTQPMASSVSVVYEVPVVVVNRNEAEKSSQPR